MFSHGQNLLNGDLEGVVTDVSQLPQYWEAIPFDDPVLNAYNSTAATPDLTDINGPLVSQGVFGYSFSGNSFVSGLFYGFFNGSNTEVYHREGIMQIVENFTVGCEYKLSFYQSVVKQFDGVTHVPDSSGSWAVYVDSELVSITTPTSSNLAFDDPNLIWEERQIKFVAKNPILTIKFVPFDDDIDQLIDNNEGLRLGIDNIKLEATNTCYSVLEIPNIFSPNGDGINDVFSPVSIYGIDEYHFTIVNRWGNTVFESNDPTVFWDGGNAEEGTYFWKVNYTDLEGRELEQEGFLTLVRASSFSVN